MRLHVCEEPVPGSSFRDSLSMVSEITSRQSLWLMAPLGLVSKLLFRVPNKELPSERAHELHPYMKFLSLLGCFAHTGTAVTEDVVLRFAC